MAASDAQLVALVLGAQETQTRLAAITAAQVGTLWDRYGGLDDDALERFSSSAAGTVRAAQVQAASLSAAFVRNYVELASGEPLSLDVDPVDVADTARAGSVTRLDVYARPVVTARAAIAAGKTFSEAIGVGRARATSTAETDVALARRGGLFRSFDSAGERVVGYRRVPDRGACTFCKVASTQRYHKRDLLALHSHCHCTVAPLVGTRDPGQIINRKLRDDLKRAANRPDYWNDPKAAIAVEEHDELGPVLVHKGDRFTSKQDLAA
jgi:hypothetical protein